MEEIKTSGEAIPEIIKPNKPKKKDKSFTVYTPVKNYCGNIAGVHFANGKAIINDGWLLKWFKEKGYRTTSE